MEARRMVRAVRRACSAVDRLSDQHVRATPLAGDRPLGPATAEVGADTDALCELEHLDSALDPGVEDHDARANRRYSSPLPPATDRRCSRIAGLPALSITTLECPRSYTPRPE